MKRTVIRATALGLSAILVSGCTDLPQRQAVGPDDEGRVGVIETSPSRRNTTPLDAVLSCYGNALRQSGGNLAIAVGDIRDYTGKQNPDQGFAITQGGALMAYSALGKLQPGIRLMERFDMRIAESELAFMEKRQLGDGVEHVVENGGSPAEPVPWLPYYGGSIRQSDYYIVGGITELNYNIHSGGVQASISNIGAKQRVYTMNVAVDLRIVGSQSLMVYDTVSIEKQVSGYEIGAGVFRFFGNELFDINIGDKSQEPLQLAVRSTIEASVLELVASVTNVSADPCMEVNATASGATQAS